MDKLEEIISSNLSSLRAKSGLTQLQVAEKINYSDKSISKWERGDGIPDIPVMLQLAELYGVTIDEIVHKHDKKPIKPKQRKLSQRALICIIASAFIWFLATVGFAVTYGFFSIVDKAWLSFIVALPINALLLIILSFCWYPYWLTAIFCSIFLWTGVLSVTLCLKPFNTWLLYIIAIPLQLIVIAGFALNWILKRKRTN